MKTPIITVIVLLCLQQHTFAGNFAPPRMHPDDRMILTLHTDLWQDVPEGIDLRSIQRGISIETMQDMPLGRSNFSIAAGLGFSSHNLYSNARYLYHPGEDAFDFRVINTDYDKNKLSLNYIDIPVQFRYRTRNTARTFRLYMGVRAGYLVNAHTKYEGIQGNLHHSEYLYMDDERKIKVKEHRLGNISKYRLGLTAMAGYGSVNISLGMPLINIFDGNSAEDMLPLSIGVTLMLF